MIINNVIGGKILPVIKFKVKVRKKERRKVLKLDFPF